MGEGIRCKDTGEGVAATWLARGNGGKIWGGVAEKRKMEGLQRQTGGIVRGLELA